LREKRPERRLSPARIEKLMVVAVCLTALLVHIVSRWP